MTTDTPSGTPKASTQQIEQAMCDAMMSLARDGRHADADMLRQAIEGFRELSATRESLRIATGSLGELYALKARQGEPVATIVFDCAYDKGVLVSKRNPQIFQASVDLMQFAPDTPIYAAPPAEQRAGMDSDYDSRNLWIALRNLMKESAGMMALAETAMRETAGHTNVHVLQLRIKEAGEILSAAPPPSAQPPATAEQERDAQDAERYRLLRTLFTGSEIKHAWEQMQEVEIREADSLEVDAAIDAARKAT